MRSNAKHNYHVLLLLRQLSTNSTVFTKKEPNLMPLGTLQRRKLNPLPLPHRTVLEPKGQDFDYVNVAHSHLIRSDWAKLSPLAAGLTPFRIKHILLKIKKDPVLSLEFFDWVELQRPNSHTLETQSIMLHILTKAKKFKIAESLLKRSIIPKTMNSASELFDCMLYSYRVCDSSPGVFDSLFKTYAHMKKFRNATDTFRRMKEYGFLPTIESCNAYMSSLLNLHRTDISLAFYREMGRCRISPNVYTLNMVVSALCKSGRLEKAVEMFKEMENMGCRPTVASFNTLIAGHSSQGLMNSAVKLKTMMSKNGLHPDIVTYNALLNGYCKEVLRGPRAGMIFFKKDPVLRFDLETTINNAVFPSLQVVSNCKALAARLIELGYKLFSGGSDNHLVLVDLRPLGIDGARVEKILDMGFNTLNKDSVPGDKSGLVAGGIRIGTPAMTTRGFKEKDFIAAAGFIHEGVQIALEAKGSISGTMLKDFLDFVRSPEFSLGSHISDLKES